MHFCCPLRNISSFDELHYTFRDYVCLVNFKDGSEQNLGLFELCCVVSGYDCWVS